MKCAGKSSKTFSAAGLVVFIVLAFGGRAFGQKKPKFAYVVNECISAVDCSAGNVSAYTIDSTTGALSPVTGSPFAARTFPFGVAVDPSGEFAYVVDQCGSPVCSNSNGNISAYTIDSTTGALSPITGSPFAAGLFSDSVAVDPSGKFAYVVNQCGSALFCTANGSVSAYTIDGTTGALTPVTGSPFAAGGILCRWRWTPRAGLPMWRMNVSPLTIVLTATSQRTPLIPPRAP